MNNIDISELARSIELYNLSKYLKKESAKDKILLELIREPFARQRTDIGKVVVAFGSYDPLTQAHSALFAKGLDVIKKDKSTDNESKPDNELLIVTSTTHFDKRIDWRKNSTIYDRVHAQQGYASCYGNVSLAFFNNPYFLYLASAVKKVYSPKINIYFIVGADVMMKVVDKKGYEDRGFDANDVMKNLFKHKFIVTERKVKIGDTERIMDLDDLKLEFPILKKYENQLISAHIKDEYARLKIPIQDVSSTIIRDKRNKHEDVSQLEAVGISDFVDKRSIYLQDSNKYSAFVCARQRFADENEDKPIGLYIADLKKYLDLLDKDEYLRDQEIARYTAILENQEKK